MPGNGIQVALGDQRQVHALGQVFANQAVGVLVGGPLPGAVWIGEEDLDLQPLGQGFMPGLAGSRPSPVLGRRSRSCGHTMGRGESGLRGSSRRSGGMMGSATGSWLSGNAFAIGFDKPSLRFRHELPHVVIGGAYIVGVRRVFTHTFEHAN